MSDSQIANVNGSLPTAAESTEQPTNLSVKLYRVWVSVDVQDRRHRTFSGEVSVYATDEDKAVRKVAARLKDGKFDDNLEMMDDEDDNVMHMMHYYDVMTEFHVMDQTLTVELSKERVDLKEIRTEIGELAESISWATETLTKLMAFLESLLSDDDGKQVAFRRHRSAAIPGTP